MIAFSRASSTSCGLLQAAAFRCFDVVATLLWAASGAVLAAGRARHAVVAPLPLRDARRVESANQRLAPDPSQGRTAALSECGLPISPLDLPNHRAQVVEKGSAHGQKSRT